LLVCSKEAFVRGDTTDVRFIATRNMEDRRVMTSDSKALPSKALNGPFLLMEVNLPLTRFSKLNGISAKYYHSLMLFFKH
jgi:hypothetical protein